MEILTLSNSTIIAKIDSGELISLNWNSNELIHQKGQPGWRNSDTEMFPLIGATSPNNFKVSTPRGTCIQDQHGLLRELNYEVISKTENSIVLKKSYLKNTVVKNSKFPDKSTEEFVSWPYDFEFEKCFELSARGLKIQFKINAEKDMPFMLGYHPAFKLSGNKTEIIKTGSKSITIDAILSAGASAYPVLLNSEIILERENNLNLKLNIKGFDNYMLWTEVDNMLCIEPITYYPNSGSECLSSNMFRTTTGHETFEIMISPFQK